VRHPCPAGAVKSDERNASRQSGEDDDQSQLPWNVIEGLLHPSDVLDTLGADAPEKLCKSAR